MTNQKKILNDEVKRFNSFFDAPTLHKKLRSKNIGLATIYRFLNALEQEGSIHSFTCENRKIYSTDKTSHAHFRCERCGKSKHIRIKNIDFIKESLTEEICHFQIELMGICAECKKLNVILFG